MRSTLVLAYSRSTDATPFLRTVRTLVLGVALLAAVDVALKCCVRGTTVYGPSVDASPRSWTSLRDAVVRVHDRYVDPNRTGATGVGVGIMIAVSALCAATTLRERRISPLLAAALLGWCALIASAWVQVPRWWAFSCG